MAERCAAFIRSPLRTPVQCSRRAVHGSRCRQHAELAAPPVDTEAAEVWRGLPSNDHRSVLVQALDGRFIPRLGRGDEVVRSLQRRRLLRKRPGSSCSYELTDDLGKRVAAYGRAQAEVNPWVSVNRSAHDAPPFTRRGASSARREAAKLAAHRSPPSLQRHPIPMGAECSWCGGDHSIGGRVWRSRRGESFCSRAHRDASGRAISALLAEETVSRG